MRLKYQVVFIFMLFGCFSTQSNADENSKKYDFSGFYGGLSYGKTTVKATATKPNASPYYIKADDDENNLGFFFGYAHNIGPVIFAIEALSQKDVATDKSSTGWVGQVIYEDLREYSFKIGYPSGKWLPYLRYGTGDVNIVWTGYPNAQPNNSDFKTMGVGFDYAISNNVVIGLDYSKANMKIYYPPSNWTEDTNLNSTRIKVAYLF